ncbi:hypothetical protein M9H77_04534 [Catharanthus roseus]|uniref:Uncharacterized protein n=1 Tax=Catharanthus roseus TaxID=4058 RepID=A0ACC0CEW5_CATRO|nr:hypothetical protein M9H77_04534 [Catharanthus roseus]
MGVCTTHCRTTQRYARAPGARHERCVTSWRTQRIMDPKQPRRKDTGLSSVADRNGRTHGHTVTASSGGLKGRHRTSDYSAVPLHESHPGASSSLAHHPETSYVHDIHQRRIPMSLEQISSYAPRSGDVQGDQHDDTAAQAWGDDQDLDVGEGRDDQGEEEEGDQDENQEEEGFEDRGVVHVFFLGHSGRDVQGATVGPLGVAGAKKRLKKFKTAWQQMDLLLEERPILRLRGRHTTLTEYEEVQEDGLGCCSFCLVVQESWIGLTFRRLGPHMPERCVSQFGQTQGIPHAPIISPVEHCRPTSTKTYVSSEEQNLELLPAGVELPPRA